MTTIYPVIYPTKHKGLHTESGHNELMSNDYIHTKGLLHLYVYCLFTLTQKAFVNPVLNALENRSPDGRLINKSVRKSHVRK